jgi:hypothetical protein
MVAAVSTSKGKLNGCFHGVELRGGFACRGNLQRPQFLHEHPKQRTFPLLLRLM